MNPAYSSIALAVFCVLSLFLYPCFLPSRTYADDPLPINPSLTIGSSGTLAFDVTPGQFNSGSQSISVATSNYTGYNLTIAPVSGDSTALVNSVTSSTIPSIATDSTESTFASPSYGFTTDSTVTSSTLYKPVLNGTTIKETNTAGTDNFNLTVGAKVASNTPAGTYTKQFTLTATANPAAYSISYNANAGSDTVTNFPSNNESSVVGDTVTISSKTPVRSGYLFVGWAETSTAYEATLQPSGTFIVDQTIDNPTKILYAVWAAPLQNWDGCDDLSAGDIVPLYDTRDNQVYKVSKYKMKADGSTTACWMSNLNLGAVPFANGVTELNSTNTHLPSDGSKDVSASTFNGWKKTSGSSSYENAEFIPVSGQDAYGNRYGTLYNYAAASAGSYTYASGSGIGDAEYDICPSGWRLPTSGSSGEFQVFYNANSITDDTTGSTKLQSDLGFSLAGYFEGSAPGSQGAYGSYWSSTRENGNSMYRLLFDASTVKPANSYGRYRGYSVRCIKDKPIMQNVSEWADSVEEGESIVAMDSRDGNDYSVARINNRLWMTQNLRITGTIPANGSNFTGSDFNVSEYDLTDATNCTGEGSSAQDPKGYSNVCSHVGVDNNGDPTAWYDFAAASAGSIKGYSNSNTPTGDICPSGWRLPTSSEQSSLLSAVGSTGTGFNPVYGGYFNGGSFRNASSHGLWWSATAYSDKPRYYMGYNDDNLYTGSNSRHVGFYIRCIKDEPIMQEVSSWGDSLLEGQEMTAVDSRDGNAYSVARLGNQLWMTQNLRITGTIPADGSNFTGSDFNVSEYDLTDATNCTGEGASAQDPKGYSNVCSRVGVDDNGDPTAWYDYAAASAGTVTGYENSNEPTGDICPSGWRLPSRTEQSSLISAVGSSGTSFNPIYGGYYNNGSLNGVETYGLWWSTTTSGDLARFYLRYRDSSLAINNGNRFNGYYIRCVKKDVPVMQDVATWGSTVANGQEVTAVDSRDGNEYTVARLGNRLWMTQNLRITGVIPADGSNFTGSDFNVSQYDLADSVNCTNSGASAQDPKGFSNVCSKVGVDNNGAPTAWYDYAAASAGTIIGYENSSEPTGDICPSGWRLPSKSEHDSLISALGSDYSLFHPVYGGNYSSGSLNGASTHGYWWSDIAENAGARFRLRFNNNILDNFYSTRYFGFYIRCIKNDLILQDVDSWGDSVSLNETVEAVDIRDGQTYKASRFKMSSDGSASTLWMSNLNLGAETLTVSNLDSSNTHLPSNGTKDVTASTFSSWVKTSGTATYTSAELIPVSGQDSYGNKYGTLYNYCAASGGTICTSTNSLDATSDLCPSGWRLPTSGNSGELKQLITNGYSITSSAAGSVSLQQDLGFSLAGSFYDSTPRSQGTHGYYWSSTRYNEIRMHYLRFTASELNPANSNERRYGVSVRCVKQAPTHTVTVSYGTGVSGVTIGGVPVSNNTSLKLEEGVSYSINMTFTSGYEFDSWSATSGTLGSASTQSTTYTIGNSNATLTASAKVSVVTYSLAYDANNGSGAPSTQTTTATPGSSISFTVSSTAPTRTSYKFLGWSTSNSATTASYTSGNTFTTNNTSNTLYAVWAPYMQDFTNSQCSTLASSGDLTVYDRRDESDYTVRYLNNQCWMTQNLRITGTISATDSNFSGSDFNVSQYDLETDGLNSGPCSEGTSSDPKGYSNVCSHYSAGDANTSNKPTAWYNYAAATAGSITGYSNSTDASSDICPSGWRLPTSTEQSSLRTAIGYSGTGFNPVYGGYYYNGSLTDDSNSGNWWSATANGGNHRYRLRYNDDLFYTGNYTRYLGTYVRCVRSS